MLGTMPASKRATRTPRTRREHDVTNGDSQNGSIRPRGRRGGRAATQNRSCASLAGSRYVPVSIVLAAFACEEHAGKPRRLVGRREPHVTRERVGGTDEHDLPGDSSWGRRCRRARRRRRSRGRVRELLGEVQRHRFRAARRDEAAPELHTVRAHDHRSVDAAVFIRRRARRGEERHGVGIDDQRNAPVDPVTRVGVRLGMRERVPGAEVFGHAGAARDRRCVATGGVDVDLRRQDHVAGVVDRLLELGITGLIRSGEVVVHDHAACSGELVGELGNRGPGHRVADCSIDFPSNPTTATCGSLGAAGNSASVARRWKPANASALSRAAKPVTDHRECDDRHDPADQQSTFQHSPSNSDDPATPVAARSTEEASTGDNARDAPPLAIDFTDAVLVIVALLSVVILVLIIVAPWRQVPRRTAHGQGRGSQAVAPPQSRRAHR